MDNRNQITISIIKKVNGRETTNIGPWIPFFKVHNFYANKTTRQIEHYLRNSRIQYSFQREGSKLKTERSIFHFIAKINSV